VNKTFLELATEVVTAMIGRGQLRVPQDKGEKWQDFNMKSIHTVGWAILEMYREIEVVPKKARGQLPAQKPVKGPKIITDLR
jgi:hypothetical protein